MNDFSPSSGSDLDRWAFFFDVDGTLADIQPRPELVFIPETTLEALAELQRRGAAVAVISGRPLAQIDQLLQSLELPAAGVHGAERRRADGELQASDLDLAALDGVEDELEAACSEYPALRLENKGIAFALHYREAPELEDVARQIAESFVARYPRLLSLQPGKCVYELKPKGANKGEVIRRFLDEEPFRGRVPVFVGDDLTDEAGFAVVNALGGLSIKVGEGASVAQRRLPSVAAVGEWIAARLTQPLSDIDKNYSEKRL
ncbi:trehalose-phosphatase [Pseudomonas kuykendallii]|uniref:trehalose-phosphatase n=1 Tax=Pseudomonas kuykendallii TaxID=1007099 RepID=UPI0028D53801|nr:trehalose-phosphatase [Pseudomonas kuykendallii]